MILCGLAVCFNLFVIVPEGKTESVRVYKYRDDSGAWRFTDTLQDSSRPVESKEAITSAPREKVRLTRESRRKGDVVFVHNDYQGPAEIEVRFLRRKNVTIHSTASLTKSDQLNVGRYIVLQSGKQPIFTVRPIDLKRSWQYRFNYRYLPGDPRAVIDEHYRYEPPIAKGGQFFISQSFNGPFSHKDPHNRYAVDIAMPVNTAVHCARSGIVMEVMNDYFWAGKNLAYYGPRSNLIRILHDDGSMGLYVHLQRGSALVRAGQHVTTGKIIARSGNTGYSTGPHLHFSVLVNRGMEVVSVPFQFKGAGGRGITPVKGLSLTNGS